jgi:nucleoside-diphosphate-sugar epimerase
MRRALVLGAGGFIGHHLVRRLVSEGVWVRGVDLVPPRFSATEADEFLKGDLRDRSFCAEVVSGSFDEVYQLAADMGGAGYIFTGDNDATIMQNSLRINLNVLEALGQAGEVRIFYSSSACVYPEQNQNDPEAPITAEESAYPAQPDSEYGWEKLISERLYLAYHRNFDLSVRIARLHNVFGPECSWNDGKEKVPAALCRKVAESTSGDEIEVWGDGQQTRSFLYIDECLEGISRLMASSHSGPVNIGSEERISINDLAEQIADIAGKSIRIRNIPGPEGVRGRSSDNRKIERELGWRPSRPLRSGLDKTYRWVEEQVAVLAG